MFGRQPRLPVDISFGLDNTKQTNGEKQPMSSYVSDLKNRLEKAHELALKATKTAQEEQKTCYDKRVRGNNIEVGDRVLVKILAFDGKHKLSNEWEEHPYIIPSKPNPDIPVFIVQKENGEGRQRNLHRNLLLPVEIFNSEDHVESKPVPAPRKKRNIPDSNRHPVVLERDAESVDDDVDDESDVFFISTKKPKSVPRPTTCIPRVSFDQTGDDQNDKRGQVMEAEGDASHPVIEESVSIQEADEASVASQMSTKSFGHEVLGGADDVSSSNIEVTGQDEIKNTNPSDNSENMVNKTPIPPPRRSKRTTKPPQWMRDGEYAVNMVCRAM